VRISDISNIRMPHARRIERTLVTCTYMDKCRAQPNAQRDVHTTKRKQQTQHTRLPFPKCIACVVHATCRQPGRNRVSCRLQLAQRLQWPTRAEQELSGTQMATLGKVYGRTNGAREREGATYQTSLALQQTSTAKCVSVLRWLW
jgi:hypothetical protein